MAEPQSSKLTTRVRFSSSARVLREGGGGRPAADGRECASRTPRPPGASYPGQTGRSPSLIPQRRPTDGSSANGRPRCFGPRDAGSTPALPARCAVAQMAEQPPPLRGRLRGSNPAGAPKRPGSPTGRRHRPQKSDSAGSNPARGTPTPPKLRWKSISMVRRRPRVRAPAAAHETMVAGPVALLPRRAPGPAHNEQNRRSRGWRARPTPRSPRLGETVRAETVAPGRAVGRPRAASRVKQPIRFGISTHAGVV
jgi:hypothetical protein